MSGGENRQRTAVAANSSFVQFRNLSAVNWPFSVAGGGSEAMLGLTLGLTIGICLDVRCDVRSDIRCILRCSNGLNPLPCSNHFPTFFSVAEPEEPNVLQRAEREVAIVNRYADRGPNER